MDSLLVITIAAELEIVKVDKLYSLNLVMPGVFYVLIFLQKCLLLYKTFLSIMIRSKFNLIINYTAHHALLVLGKKVARSSSGLYIYFLLFFIIIIIMFYKCLQCTYLSTNAYYTQYV